MKKMKRLAALFLAVVMVMAMGMTAFATEVTEEEDTTYTISVKDGVPAGHTYEVYQIFKGTLSKDGTILSDIEYGENFEGQYKEGTDIKTYANAKAAAESVGTTDADANAFAERIVLKPTTKKLEGTTPLSLTESGYYLVKDIGTGAEGDRVSNFIVKLGGNSQNLIIEPKRADVPGFDKTVDDGKKATVSHAAGDEIDFTLTATMPDDFAKYDTYQLTFNDTLTNLTYKEGSAQVVYVNGDDKVDYTSEEFVVTAGSVTTKENGVSEQSLTVAMENVKKTGVVAGTKVILTYKAILSNSAVSGEVGSNKATLKYGNDGNDQGSGVTESSEVKVYTFALNFNKVIAGTTTPLPGAGFTLYDENDKEVESLAAGEATNFVFDGLKAGTYTLEETEVPDGYNKMENVTIVINGTPDGTNINATVTVDGETVTESTTWKLNNFVLGANVENAAGVTLPSTGGIGTTIFYVVGGILVLGAGVLLITKKRMSARD